MDFSRAVGNAVDVMRDKPGDIIPVFLLSPAAPVIARAVLILGVVVAYIHAVYTGRIEMFVEALREIDLSLPSEDAPVEEMPEWISDVSMVFDALITPFGLLVLFISLFLGVSLLLVLFAGIQAAQLSCCLGRLRGNRGLTDAIRGARRYWIPLLLINLLEIFLFVSLSLVALVVTSVFFALHPLIGGIVGAFAGLVWFAALIGLRAVFVFVPVAVVVDDSGVIKSFRESVGFISGRPSDAVGYYVLSIGVLFGLISLIGVTAPFGGSELLALALVVVVSPFLALTKTGLYASYREVPMEARDPVDLGIWEQVMAGVRRGWSEMELFIRGHPWFIVSSIGVIVIGFVVGWMNAEPFVGVISTSIEDRLIGFIPPREALFFFSNNFTVAVTTALSGVVFGLPTVSSLWYNGVVYGFMARLEENPVVLVLFVLPHGVLEVPAFVISGAAGLWLGVVFLRYVTGGASIDEAGDALERVFWVVVGAGLLLVAAALIEGFFSPYYFRLFM